MPDDRTAARIRNIDKLIDRLEVAESVFFVQKQRGAAEQVRIVIDTGIELVGMLRMYGTHPELLKTYYKFLNISDLIRVKFNQYATIEMS